MQSALLLRTILPENREELSFSFAITASYYMPFRVGAIGPIDAASRTTRSNADMDCLAHLTSVASGAGSSLKKAACKTAPTVLASSALLLLLLLLLVLAAVVGQSASQL